MPNLGLSGIWAQIPWRRRKDEPAESISAKRKLNAQLRDWRPFSRGREAVPSTTSKSEFTQQDRKLSRIWETEDVSEKSPMRSLSASYRRFTRSFEPSTTNAASSLSGHSNAKPDETTNANESLLDRLHRKSQAFTLPRPRTSSGISRRRSFWGTAEADDAEIPAVPIIPALTEAQRGARLRHVPITIDYLQVHLEGDPLADRGSDHNPGLDMPVPCSKSHETGEKTTSRPRDRPVSFSSSFSQLRQRTSLFSSQKTIPEHESEVSADEHDLITALPALDSPYTPFERQTFQQATPKVIDILAPQPVTMISASSTPKVRSRPSTSNGLPTLDRRQRTFQPPETEMNDEDGPKGDWARTRHSWLSMENDTADTGPEQMEWDKLKQFIEAYSGGGGDTGVISIRQVDDSSDSSGSSVAKPVTRYSNAQALAALEFGLA